MTKEALGGPLGTLRRAQTLNDGVVGGTSDLSRRKGMRRPWCREDRPTGCLDSPAPRLLPGAGRNQSLVALPVFKGEEPEQEWTERLVPGKPWPRGRVMGAGPGAHKQVRTEHAPLTVGGRDTAVPREAQCEKWCHLPSLLAILLATCHQPPASPVASSPRWRGLAPGCGQGRCQHRHLGGWA